MIPFSLWIRFSTGNRTLPPPPINVTRCIILARTSTPYSITAAMAPNSSMPRRLRSQVFQCAMQGASHRHQGSQLCSQIAVGTVTLDLGAPGEQPLSVVSGQHRKPFILSLYHTGLLALALTPRMRQFNRSPSSILPICTSSFNIEPPSIYSSSIAARGFHTTSILLAGYLHVLLYFAFTRRLSWVWPCSFNPTG